jgi:uncharacterized protein involved in exopolysaccharide biosynthesis
MEEKQTQHEDEINLLDYLIVLLKRKRLIISITLGAAIITAVISLIMPPIYRAETKILPPQPQQAGIAAQLMAQFGGAAGALGIPIHGRETTNDLYIRLLKSRPVLDNIIDRFDLMRLYKTESREDARNTVVNALKASDDRRSGLITIGFCHLSHYFD